MMSFPQSQFLAVKKRGGGYDTARTLFIVFAQNGTVERAENKNISHDLVAPIIPISRSTYRDTLIKLGLLNPRRRLTPEERKESRRLRSTAYRAGLARLRATRTGRFVDNDDRERVVNLLRAGLTGTSISVLVGVSTSYVSRLRTKLKQLGEL